MAGRLRGGSLRHTIIIQRSNETQGSRGEVITTWTNIKITRAEIKPIKGDEYFLNQNMVSDLDHYMKLRYTDVKPKDRIIFDGKIYDLEYVLNIDERKRELLILAIVRASEVYIEDRSDLLLENGFSLLTESGAYLINEGIN